jgi:uncharacterized protein (UPF0276 family)
VAASPRSEAGVGPIPARAGVGLRAQHHARVIDTRPAVAWFEVHAENFFADGGPQLLLLEQVRARYPLSVHGVGLGLGSTDPLDLAHLRALRRLVDRFEPGLVSEHLCWAALGGRHHNDLLPLPCTEESLRHCVARVGAVQHELGRRIAIENLSSYVRFDESTLTEWEFVAALAAESGCALLLDVNNVYVNACNHGFDPAVYIDAMPQAAVAEIHLAGHAIERHGDRELRVDTHGSHVCDAVWSLYERALRRLGPLPTLIEWDTDIPALDVLLEEAARAQRRLDRCHAVAA